MANFQTKADLPASDQAELARVLAIASAQRTTVEANFLTARSDYQYNEKLAVNAALEITVAAGNTIPTGLANFAKGAIFLKKDAATTLAGTYVNVGTNTSALWKLVGQKTAEAVTATTDGTGTGVISEIADHVTVTSSASTKVVTLPAPVVGKQVVIDVGASGFKLQTTAPATIGINGGTGASAVSAIAANSTCVMVCVSATSWKGYFLDADSDVAKVAAAA